MRLLKAISMRNNWVLMMLLLAVFVGKSIASPRPAGLGTVGGQVLDMKGKPVGDAHVTVQSSEGSDLQTTKTNAEGHFWFPFLSEGQYSVRAYDHGRVSEWRKNVWVSPGRKTDITLHLGPHKEQLQPH